MTELACIHVFAYTFRINFERVTIMYKLKTNYVYLLLSILVYGTPALADHPKTLPELTVGGEVDTGFNPTHIELDAIRSGISDTSELIKKSPWW